MDPNTSIRWLCFGEDNHISLNDGIESNGEKDTPEYYDTRDSGEKNVAKAFTFYKIKTEEPSDHYVTPCFMNGLHAYDGEINLKNEGNMISNEFPGYKTLREKNDPRVFVLPIHIETKFNTYALVDTGTNINVMPYRIYAKLGREEVKPMSKKITMMYHSKADQMRILKDVICQVGVTTILARFLILDILVDKDMPIVMGRSFLYSYGGIINTIKCTTLTFNSVCHQKIYVAAVRNNHEESDEDKKEYIVKRDRNGKPIYGPKFAKYLNFDDPIDPLQHNEWLPSYSDYFIKKGDGDGKWHAKVRIIDPYGNVYDKGYQTKATNRKLSKFYKLNDIMSPDWFSKMEEIIGIIKRSESYSQSVAKDDHLWVVSKNNEFITRMAKRMGLLTDEVLNGLSALTFCKALDATTLIEMINSNGRLIAEDPTPRLLRGAMPRPPRSSMHDLYDRMGNMEICQGVLERMARRQSYQFDKYTRVFEYIRQHGVPLQGAYAPSACIVHCLFNF
nr:hypothetical protein [Tanacetum cinerariifolium]